MNTPVHKNNRSWPSSSTTPLGWTAKEQSISRKRQRLVGHATRTVTDDTALQDDRPVSEESGTLAHTHTRSSVPRHPSSALPLHHPPGLPHMLPSSSLTPATSLTSLPFRLVAEGAPHAPPPSPPPKPSLRSHALTRLAPRSRRPRRAPPVYESTMQAVLCTHSSQLAPRRCPRTHPPRPEAVRIGRTAWGCGFAIHDTCMLECTRLPCAGLCSKCAL